MSLIRHIVLTGAGIGIGFAIGRSYGQTEEEKSKNAKIGATIGGVLGLSTSLFIKWMNSNTVNYTLKYKGKHVYDGITFQDRLDVRMIEHRASGKKFDSVIVDKPRERSEALLIEKNRIKLNRGKYNVQHKSN